jgi:hypothetical protein
VLCGPRERLEGTVGSIQDRDRRSICFPDPLHDLSLSSPLVCDKLLGHGAQQSKNILNLKQAHGEPNIKTLIENYSDDFTPAEM